jgi:hypothetical protein
MKKILFAILAVVLLGVVMTTASAQIDNSTLGYPKYLIETPVKTSTVSAATASTTAVVVSALADRRYIHIRVSEANKELWVSTSSTAATVSGAHCVLVTSTQPLSFSADASLPISHIASEAFAIKLIQQK